MALLAQVLHAKNGNHPALLQEVHNLVKPPERVQLVGRERELQQAFQALAEGRYVEVVGGPGEGKTCLVQHLVEAVCDQWRRQPAAEKGGRVAHALEVDLSLSGRHPVMLHDSTTIWTWQLLFKLPDCRRESVGLAAGRCCQNGWCGVGFVCCRVGRVPRANEQQKPWAVLDAVPSNCR